MASFQLGEIVIDIPRERARELLDFYATLTGFTPEFNETHPSLLENANGLDLGLQGVDDYQAPTWPSQERGQQMHLDFATPDIEAAATWAETIGATRAPDQPAEAKDDDDFIVMLDPVGHPFCFVPVEEQLDGPMNAGANGEPAIFMRMAFIDCPDHVALAEFYVDLLDAEIPGEPDEEYVAIRTPHGQWLGFQRVEGYQPPTWPTQERGQQLHFDVRVDTLEEAVQQATALGAEVAFRGTSHVVMLDPAGHPFCLGAG